MSCAVTSFWLGTSDMSIAEPGGSMQTGRQMVRCMNLCEFLKVLEV